MTRIVHLTDLHFGSEKADLVPPLTQAIRLAAPDLVVVTGDLTHRGRVGQFQTAMDFLHGLKVPFVTMPGNHDVPLFNLPLRLVAPFRNWRLGTGLAMTSERVVQGVRVVASNTADPLSWRKGRLRAEDVDRAVALGQAQTFGIFASHHPLSEPPGFDRGETKGAASALPRLAARGIDVILSGHLHHWEFGVGITDAVPKPLLMIQTGTALCDRAGEADHGFAVLDFDEAGVTAVAWQVDLEGNCFSPGMRKRFLRKGGLWHLAV